MIVVSKSITHLTDPDLLYRNSGLNARSSSG